METVLLRKEKEYGASTVGKGWEGWLIFGIFHIWRVVTKPSISHVSLFYALTFWQSRP